MSVKFGLSYQRKNTVCLTPEYYGEYFNLREKINWWMENIV
jgi:hypothetical protein